MSAADHLECFIPGLREDIRHELMMLCPYYVSQALQLALQIEAKLLISNHQQSLTDLRHHRRYHTTDSTPLFSAPTVKDDDDTGVSQELIATEINFPWPMHNSFVTTTNFAISAIAGKLKQLLDDKKF